MKTFQRNFTKSIEYAILDRDLNKVKEITSETIIKTEKAKAEVLTKLDLEPKGGYTFVPVKINEEIRIITEEDFLKYSHTEEEWKKIKEEKKSGKNDTEPTAGDSAKTVTDETKKNKK